MENCPDCLSFFILWIFTALTFLITIVYAENSLSRLKSKLDKFERQKEIENIVSSVLKGEHNDTK